MSALLGLEKEPSPVGEDYVEIQKTEDGKGVQYYCKLCDCRFNDMNAKDMHLKGRRHRLQFKVSFCFIFEHYKKIIDFHLEKS
jgi:hypothetical protein